MLAAAAAVLVVAVGAAVVVAIALGQLSAPFLCAKIKHKLSVDIAITNILKMHNIPEIKTSSSHKLNKLVNNV